MGFRIGLIGAGGMGRHLASKLAAIESAEITGVYDPVHEAATQAASQFGARAYSSDRELVEAHDVDAVIIAGPPNTHHDQTTAAAAAGKHIFCEKPLATTVADCETMLAAAAQTGVTLYVGQALRFFRLFWKSKEILDSGEIGTPRVVSITRAGLMGNDFHSGWRSRREECGGLLMEVNAHEFDYMRWVLGDVESVFAAGGSIRGMTDYDDFHFVCATFVGDRRGQLHSSLSSAIGEYRVHIQCDGGTMLHGGFGGEIRWKTWNGEEHRLAAEEIVVPDPYERELREFVGAARHGEPTTITARDGLEAVRMAEMAYRSAETRHSIDSP